MPEQEGSDIVLGLELPNISQEMLILMRIYLRILKSLLEQQTTKYTRKFGFQSLLHIKISALLSSGSGLVCKCRPTH